MKWWMTYVWLLAGDGITQTLRNTFASYETIIKRNRRDGKEEN